MESNLVNVQLSVEKKESSLIAHLFFQNITSSKLYLDKQTIYYEDVVRNTYFEIFNGDGGEVDYKGMMLKRDILPEGFIPLDPGEQINSSVKLNEFYEVRMGRKYSIQYYAFNPGYLEEQGLMEMQSNKVEIVY